MPSTTSLMLRSAREGASRSTQSADAILNSAFGGFLTASESGGSRVTAQALEPWIPGFAGTTTNLL